jgi:hypothetical protein
MAYTLNSLKLMVQSIDNVIPARWALSGTDSDATVLAAGYISDAQHLGVKVGDIVDYYLTSGPELYTHIVTAVVSTGATLGSSPSTSS